MRSANALIREFFVLIEKLKEIERDDHTLTITNSGFPQRKKESLKKTNDDDDDSKHIDEADDDRRHERSVAVESDRVEENWRVET